ILAANVAGKRARIVLHSPQPIRLETSLPPLVNPEGIILEGDSAHSSEINAQAIERGPVFDVASPYSLLRGIKITSAQEIAVLARADGIRLSQMRFETCDTCISVASSEKDFVLEDSHIMDSRIGIALAADNTGVTIRNNQFRADRDAAIWAVRNSVTGILVSS